MNQHNNNRMAIVIAKSMTFPMDNGARRIAVPTTPPNIAPIKYGSKYESTLAPAD